MEKEEDINKWRANKWHSAEFSYGNICQEVAINIVAPALKMCWISDHKNDLAFGDDFFKRQGFGKMKACGMNNGLEWIEKKR